MHIAFAVTNPCHIYDLALELSRRPVEVSYYSGYPRWRLNPPAEMHFIPYSSRTYITYALQRFPPWCRPSMGRVFKWQDGGFDRGIARRLRPADFIHGLPGQCHEIFRKARKLGIKTVLNHASGPLRERLKLIEPEYKRLGLAMPEQQHYDDAYFQQESEEYSLADYHCVASSVVKEQLIALGIPAERIWVVPYGADTGLFEKSLQPVNRFNIVFAGQLVLRKGLHTLFKALESLNRPDWEVNLYGVFNSEIKHDFEQYRGRTSIKIKGPISQKQLASVFKESAVLVLPSIEEGFGLVVVQALQAGVPCLVSDHVGAKDLIRHRENGSVFPVRDASALAAELDWWNQHPRRVSDIYDWTLAADCLLDYSNAALGGKHKASR